MNHKYWVPRVLVQGMAGQDYSAERREANQEKAEDGVDEAEEGRADAVGDEANNNDQRGEPGHQACGGHQDSPHGSAIAQDRMSEGKPVGGNANPVKYG